MSRAKMSIALPRAGDAARAAEGAAPLPPGFGQIAAGTAARLTEQASRAEANEQSAGGAREVRFRLRAGGGGVSRLPADALAPTREANQLQAVFESDDAAQIAAPPASPKAPERSLGSRMWAMFRQSQLSRKDLPQ